MRAFLLRRHEAEVGVAAERADRLRASAVDLARLLRGRFGVNEVWLFGSLAWGAPDAHADIDLAVTGLAPQDCFPALTALLAAAPASVDLVRLEDAPPALCERVARDGRRLTDAA
jgi:predicted nucleotidyltransferase